MDKDLEDQITSKFCKKKHQGEKTAQCTAFSAQKVNNTPRRRDNTAGPS